MIAFRHPQAFWMLAAFAVLCAVYAWSRARRRRDLSRLGDWRLVSGLLPVPALARRRMKDRIALTAFAVLILAAAGPLFGTRLKEVKQRGVDVFVAIDTSRSMLAEDVSPNRLDRAKRSLSYLVSKLAGNRIGIIAFAKRAIVVCPLTVDPDAARLFLESVNTNTVPEQGTGVGSAIRQALARFPKDAKSGRAIVLLTDGEDTGSDPIGAAREAKAQGVPVFTIGIGTAKGEVIKDRDDQGNITSFHKHKGEMVVTKLDDAMLTKVSEISGGAYYRATSTDREIDEIADALNGFEKREFASRVVDRLSERYQWPAAAALFLLILEFFMAESAGQRARVMARLRAMRPRRKTAEATAAALALLFLFTVPAAADVRQQVREGNRLFKKGDFEGALKAFESAQIDEPDSAEIAFDVATTKYAAGDLEAAVKEYDRAAAMTKDPRARARIAYNAGHALFHADKREEAMEKFKETLRLDPTDVDAKYNLEYIKSGKTPPPQKPKPDKSDKNEKPKDDEKKPEDTPQSKDGEGEKKEKDKSEDTKPGEISREAAEQILQMTQDQESSNMKLRPVRPLGDKNVKPAAGGEDW